jgi:hypothetical protein
MSAETQMPYAPEATPLHKLRNLWTLAAVTYGIVIGVTIAAVVAYKHYWPTANSEELALEKRSASITVGAVWIPIYPGAMHKDMTSSTHGAITEGDLSFSSSDSPAQLAAYYRARFEQAKFSVTYSEIEGGSRIEAMRESSGQSIARLTFSAAGAGTDAKVHTQYTETKP